MLTSIVRERALVVAEAHEERLVGADRRPRLAERRDPDDRVRRQVELEIGV
jgi:hypothetical protein